MKKLLSIILIFIFILSTSVYAFPLEPVPQCADCGAATVLVYKYEDTWTGPVSQRVCIHNQGGYDYKYTRTVEKHFRCDHCGYSVSIPSQESKWFCQGIITKN